MKHLFKVFIFAYISCCCHSLHAQESYQLAPQPPGYPIVNQYGATLSQVLDTMKAHIGPGDTAEGGPGEQLKSFHEFWRLRVGNNDSSGVNMFIRYYMALRTAVIAGESSPCSSGGYDGAWSLVGPVSMPGQEVGYLNAVWADTAGDSNYILAGSVYGGLFKTTDGGANWACITDNAPLVGGVMGVSNIAVNPRNINTIYLGTTGAAIIKSFDRGNTWQQEIIPAYGGYADTVETVQGIYLTPDSTRLYAFVGDSVYTRYNVGSGNPWVNITPAGVATGMWKDLQFLPGDQTHFFISSGKQSAGIWEATTSVPATWTNITAGLTATIGGVYTSPTGWASMDMSIPDNDTVFFIAMDSLATFPYVGLANLYKYSISAATITLIKSDLPVSSHNNPNTGHFSLIVSPAGTGNNLGRRKIYYASDVPFASYDEGNSFYQIGEYDANPTHADIRCMYLQTATNTLHGAGDRLFLATDGGISKKPAGIDDSLITDAATIDISGNGLACGTFNGFYTSEAGLGIGGMMHDGVVGYEPAQAVPWAHLDEEDAWTTTFSNAKPTVGYAFEGFGSVYLDSTAPVGTRELGKLDSFPQPLDLGGIGPPIGTDNFGAIYCGTDKLSVYTPATGAFLHNTLGFPDDPGDFIGAIEFSPYTSDFTGYVLYYYANQIYYRNPAITGFGTPALIDTVPGTADGNHLVNCLVTDPLNTQRVWAAIGNRPYNTTSPLPHNLVYSTDNGTTWVEVSSGLPEYLPVTKMAYDEAANIVYAATDAGIFKCDFNGYDPGATFTSGGDYYNNSISWSCFRKGLVSGHDFPNVNVTKLAINHCEGKLYASTYGRSVWATDINAPGDIVNPTIFITPGSTVWSGQNQYISGSIDVEAGAVFTISGNDTVHMPKGGVISVEPGGQLIVDNSEITNDCQCMWQGIQARGQVSLPQIPTSNQGWVVIRNNSTIKNAVIGVANSNTNISWSSNGGIIQCSNSSFVDCQTSAAFAGYDNFYLGHLDDNLSSFTNCTFLLDNNYSGASLGLPMNNMLLMQNVEGIKITGCQFLNRNTTPPQQATGVGIEAYNTGFRVLSYCPSSGIYGVYGGCPHTVYSRFCGFAIGADIRSTNPWGLTTSIDEAQFDTVSIGIDVSAFNNVSTTRCTFNIGNGGGIDSITGETFNGCAQNIGILTQNAPQFYIEGNNFMGKPEGSTIPDFYNYGVVVGNSGGVISRIYSNAFDSLTYGVYSIGDNKDNTLIPDIAAYVPNIGPQILCNSFSRDGNDIMVVSDSGYYPQGITNQALGGVAAGNTFANSDSNIVNHVPLPAADYFIYTYDATHPSTDNPTLISGVCSYCGPTIMATTGKSCPSSFGSTYATFSSSAFSTTALSMSALYNAKQTFNTNKAMLQNALVTYNNAMDFGNTDSLVHVIDTSAGTTILYSTLGAGSPYISETALEEVANDMALPYTSMLNILLLNPDDLKDGAFLNYVNNDYSFSPGDMASLVAASGSTTARTELTNSIGAAQMTMGNQANMIMLALKSPIDTNVSLSDTTGAGICTDSTSVYYMQDSNSYYVGLDSIDTWLQNIGGLWTNYERVGYYNWLGQLTTADSIFTNLGTLIPLADTINRPTYDTFAHLWNAIKDAEADGRNEYSLNSYEIGLLDTSSVPEVTNNMAEMEIINVTPIILPGGRGPISPCIAEAVLHKSDSRHSHAGVPTPAIPPIININDNTGNNQFSAYPNPTSGVVTFSYSVQDGSHDISIVVTNVVGEKIADIEPGNPTGRAYWNPVQAPAGIYIYTASDGKGIISKGKLVLVK